MATTASAKSKEHSLAASPAPVLPDPSSVFLDRSERFASLAQGHSLSDWLSFLGRLTRVQHELLQVYSSTTAPRITVSTAAPDRSLPPIPASSWSRDPSWRKLLASLSDEMASCAPGPARGILLHLAETEAARIEALADRVLRLELTGQEADSLPFVAAALQIYWTALAARLDPASVKRSGTPDIFCPACGYPAVSAVVRADKLRYLHCALCNTEWHMVRATCAACGDAGQVGYYHIDGGDGSVRAETCDACRGYLKIVYRDKSPEADPVADDLATLALDLLVDEAGYERTGPNLLFAPHP
jgi:FdhE protein